MTAILHDYPLRVQVFIARTDAILVWIIWKLDYPMTVTRMLHLEYLERKACQRCGHAARDFVYLGNLKK